MLLFLSWESELQFRDDDARLVASALSGNADAFGELVEKYEKLVYNAAYQLVRSEEDALDVAQETFLKAFRSLNSFRGDCRFSTWLYKICRNAALDYLRAEQRRRTVSLTEEDEDGSENVIDPPDPDLLSDPQRRLEQKEDRLAVRAAINRLSREHREILVLRDMEGYSYEEIAEMLDLELGTVKSRINRARRAVKDFLKNGNFLAKESSK